MQHRISTHPAWPVLVVLLFIVFSCATGCTRLPKASLPFLGKKAQVVAPANAETPTTVSTARAHHSTRIPRNSRVITHADGSVEIIVAEDTAIETTADTAAASIAPPRPPDKAVELRKEDNAARRPLLYAALACILPALFFVWRGYPTPAMLCGGAAVVLFVAWQAAGLPSWFWMLAVVLGGIGAGIYFGYERGEKVPPPS
jgi:hypothetical protein